MKLAEVRQTYYDSTAKTSEITRNLGFAGIALIWIFKSGTESNQTIPNSLLTPAILLVVSLGLDLCQYVAASLAWGIFNRVKELSKTSDKSDFDAPPYINWATLLFFWTKILSMAAAYIYLIIFLRSRFN